MRVARPIIFAPISVAAIFGWLAYASKTEPDNRRGSEGPAGNQRDELVLIVSLEFCVESLAKEGWIRRIDGCIRNEGFGGW
jgi:hypothetical protein